MKKKLANLTMNMKHINGSILVKDSYNSTTFVSLETKISKASKQILLLFYIRSIP